LEQLSEAVREEVIMSVVPKGLIDNDTKIYVTEDPIIVDS
jgi:hypothetical protein